MKIVFALLGVGLAERGGPGAFRPRRQLAPAEEANDERRAKNYDTGAGYDTGYEATGLKCWHCDAMSFEECESKGQERTCHSNAGSCFLEIRERRMNGLNGQDDFMQICMGCKSDDACQNMKNQNFQNQNPDYTQCRPESNYADSVCRQCCDTDNCTRDPDWWYPQSREEWDYTGEESSYGYKK